MIKLNNNIKLYVFCLLILTFSVNGYAQDIHFSQFYASPLTMNPAMTGMMDGTFRATAQYREQWSSFMDPYTTTGVSAERNFPLENGDRPGAGIVIVNDRTGKTSGISTIKVHLSGSYNKLFKTSGNGNIVLGAGFQLGFVQKSIFGDFTYPDQWVNGAYNGNVAIENFNGNSISYMDINFGTLCNYVFGIGSSVFIGGAVYHLNRPKEMFLDGTLDNRLEPRWVSHGGSRLVIGSGEISVIPNFIMMFQNGAREINLGTSFEVDFGMLSAIQAIWTIGGWYRLNDAMIIATGIGVKDFMFGISYDINTSSLKVASNKKGAFELSLRYQFKSKSIKLKGFPGLKM
jgi:type IX secretion system PorP/SprF family membrane protein